MPYGMPTNSGNNGGQGAIPWAGPGGAATTIYGTAKGGTTTNPSLGKTVLGPGYAPSSWVNGAAAVDRPSDILGSLPIFPDTTTPTNGNLNPYGGSSSTYKPGISQGDYDTIMGMIGQTQPVQQKWTPVDLPDWNAPAFRPWDDSMYTQARGTINDQINAGRQSGNQAYTDARYEINQQQNPWAGQGYVQSPNIQNQLSRMFAANGIDTGILAGTANEAMQSNDVMGQVRQLLGGNYDARQQSNLRANTGDARAFNENLSSQQRMLLAQVDQQLAKAKAQYDKDKDERAYADAVKRHGIATDEILMNNQGVNATNAANVQSQNSFMQGLPPVIADLIKAGYDSKGKQGLNTQSAVDLPKMIREAFANMQGA